MSQEEEEYQRFVRDPQPGDFESCSRCGSEEEQVYPVGDEQVCAHCMTREEAKSQWPEDADAIDRAYDRRAAEGI